jgi:thymidylate synthase (FAD)
MLAAGMRTDNKRNMEKGFIIPVLDHGYVQYVDHMGTDTRIVESARVSYGAGSKGEEADKKLLAYLYKHRHTTPFEMCKITFNIKMPIFVARQYIRHRMQNVNEFSMRYSEAPDEFYIPTDWRAQDTTKNKQGSLAQEGGWNPNLLTDEVWTATDAVQEHSKACFELYQQLLGEGIAREMARMVLPLNIYTMFYATWDLKNLLHFITLREDAHAQAEIQEYGKAMKRIMKELFPWTIEAYEKYKWVVVEDGLAEPVKS